MKRSPKQYDYDKNGIVVKEKTVAELVEQLLKCNQESKVDFYIIPPFNTPTASVGEFSCINPVESTGRVSFVITLCEPDNINW